MNTSRTDFLNILLMVVSALLAYNLPFELFLFSYAILGPLHYLTEIGWLHQRSYFTSRKNDYWFLIVCSVLISIVFLWSNLPSINNYIPIGSPEELELWRKAASFYSSVIVFTALIAGISMCVFSEWWKKGLLVAGAVIVGFYCKEVKAFIMLFAMLVPTLVHVWLFTGLFMLSGAIKGKSASGYLSLLIFVLCSISFFFSTYKLQPYPVSEYIKNSIYGSGFANVHLAVKDFILGINKTVSMNQGTGLKIQRFIAFAYTYHYLNWFSKTNIIKWHQVPKKVLITTLFLWVLSILFYWYDYKTGTFALFFLSIMHVFLEFPLNIRSTGMLIDSVRGNVQGPGGKVAKKILFKPKTF